jgi:vacuolar-type H+-ATPase subunit I/STV1
MKRRIILTVALELGLIALVAGMFAFSVRMVRQERDWREQGTQAGPAAQIAVDVSNWWLQYWWAAVPFIVFGGLGMAAVIAFTGRPALQRVHA